MKESIFLYKLSSQEASQWSEVANALGRSVYVNDCTEVKEYSEKNYPVMVVANVKNIIELLDLVKVGIPAERIVLTGQMERMEDHRAAFRMGVMDWFPKFTCPNEIETKLEWHLVKNYGPGIEKKDFGKLHMVESLKLTRKEEEILLHISKKPNCTKKELFETLWMNQKVTKKTIDVHLFNLRRKLREIGRDIVQLENGILQVA